MRVGRGSSVTVGYGVIVVYRGFASPVGSSRGLRGRNVTVGARQVHERWSAYTCFCTTSIPTTRIYALRRDYIASLCMSITSATHHTIYDDHLPPLMYCTDAISLHAAYDPPCAYAGGEEDGRLLPYSLHTSLPI